MHAPGTATGDGGPRRALLEQVLQLGETLLAALGDPALVRDADGRLAAANAAATELLPLARTADGWDDACLAAAVCSADGRAVAPDDLPAARVLASGRSEHGRLLGLTRPDGALRWVEVDARPLVTDAGVALGVVETYRDVTSRREAEQRTAFQARLLEAVGQAVIATDAEGCVTYWNAAAEALYGWSADEALGCPIVDLTPSQATAEQAEEIMVALRAGLAWTGDFLVQRRDGSTFTALVTNRPLVDADGTVVGVIGVSTDVTERVRAERAAQRLSAVVDSTGDSVLLVDLDGTVQSWNRAAEQLYGWTAAETVGRHLSASIVVPEALDELAAVLTSVAAGDTVRDVETVRRRKDGSLLEVALTASPVRGPDGTVDAASFVARDIGARRTLERALEHAALHDDLTGLPNRALLGDRLEQALAVSARTSVPLAVLFVDLDAFKDVNDGQGHLLGDAVLAEVADRLRAQVRPGDTVARFGGDEFVVLLPGADEAVAREVADRLLETVRQPLELEGRRLHVSASIGVAVSPPVPGGSLLRAADAAVYDAKAKGRDRVSVFVGTLAAQAEERLRLSAELHDALDGGSVDALHLVYQPVMDLRRGAVLGVEALLRWEHPERGPVPPGQFVPLAESTGLGVRLDAWVLHRACAEFAALRSDGTVAPDTYVAVNVTPRSVVDPGFVELVLQALGGAGLPPSSLVLEVTETGVVQDLEAAVEALTELREHGVRVALDDFGTGWSSLTWVRRLPASILKLDRTFVDGLATDDDDLAIAASVVELGRSTGLTVVAEGVEQPEQLAVLRQLGCPAGQGFLWHAGVPAEELAEALVAAAAPPSVPEQRRPRPERSTPLGPEHGLERLWELHGEGASLASIAAALNKDGYRRPTGQRWHSRSVARVLVAPAVGSSG